jgi:hypothetical protein
MHRITRFLDTCENLIINTYENLIISELDVKKSMRHQRISNEVIKK